MAPFGTIVQWFARHEYLMEVIAANLSGCPIANAAFFMAETGYAGKRNITKSLISLSSLEPKKQERLQWLLGQLHKHNQLRNAIAHNTWCEGTRSGSIKPLGIRVRTGKAEITGIDPSEPDHTTAELWAAADDLAKNYNQLRDYLVELEFLKDIDR